MRVLALALVPALVLYPEIRAARLGVVEVVEVVAAVEVEAEDGKLA